MATNRWRRVGFGALAGLLLLVGGIAAGMWSYARSLNSDVRRTDAFHGLGTGRPGPSDGGALNILVLGSDSRDPNSTADSRSDTMMLAHLDGDHRHAYVISIPRDTWVFVPQAPDGQSGNTMSKINSAYSWGGVPLAVATVEKFTEVRVDHVLLIDFAGFQQVVDSLGGVDMDVDQTITSIFPPHRVFQQGRRHFTGAEALDYVRQRYQFPGGDFAREAHQQELLKALLDKAASTGKLTNLGTLNAFLQSITKVITVDKNFDVISLGMQVHGLRSSDLTFLTSPSSGTGTQGGQEVVYPDADKVRALYRAVKHDSIDRYLAAHGTPSTPSAGPAPPTDAPQPTSTR